MMSIIDGDLAIARKLPDKVSILTGSLDITGGPYDICVLGGGGGGDVFVEKKHHPSTSLKKGKHPTTRKK